MQGELFRVALIAIAASLSVASCGSHPTVSDGAIDASGDDVMDGPPEGYISCPPDEYCNPGGRCCPAGAVCFQTPSDAGSCWPLLP
jgi:hypothetical protein